MAAPQCRRKMDDISADLACKFGVRAQHSRMDNGELRYRLVSNDGSAYVRTEASAVGGWQNSHYHKSVLETYIIQNGWAAFAEFFGDDVRLWIMQPGDVYTTQVGVPHNIYLPAHAVTHVVKHGHNGQIDDWFADPSLDEMTKDLTEAEILIWKP
jgi:hypothetical protein